MVPRYHLCLRSGTISHRDTNEKFIVYSLSFHMHVDLKERQGHVPLCIRCGSLLCSLTKDDKLLALKNLWSHLFQGNFQKTNNRNIIDECE